MYVRKHECDIRGLGYTLKDTPGVDYIWERRDKERKNLGIQNLPEPEEEV
jgi:hypothetical protein